MLKNDGDDDDDDFSYDIWSTYCIPSTYKVFHIHYLIDCCDIPAIQSS